MQSVTEYLERAIDCLSMASKTEDENKREECARQAREYMRRAAELSEQKSAAASRQ